VIVYQAFRPETGRYAAEHGRFGPGFSLGRMSWIKPNFLWMMFRSGWATKPGQEVVLAIRLRRDGFDEVLRRAVASTFNPEVHGAREAWEAAVARSDVRFQWDPDHHPSGAPVSRRAIQLGLRGEALERYAREWIAGIEDISDLVADGRARADQAWEGLIVPREEVYPVPDGEVAARLGLSAVAR